MAVGSFMPTTLPEPDYRAFLRDLIKLCKKHNVSIHAYDEGRVEIQVAGARCIADAPGYSALTVNPNEGSLRESWGNLKDISL